MVQAFAALSFGAQIGIGVVLAVSIWVLGMIATLALGGRGFGVVVNGMLMLIGFAAGAFARFAVFGAP